MAGTPIPERVLKLLKLVELNHDRHQLREGPGLYVVMESEEDAAGYVVVVKTEGKEHDETKALWFDQESLLQAVEFYRKARRG